jgi:imidazolonepropionase-like amidohydrolase
LSPQHHLRAPLLGLALLASCSTGTDYRGTTLYAGFTLVDPQAETSTADAWVVIADGAIREMGSGTPPDGDFDEVHDLSGLYGMPGLIDAHAHVTTGPFESGIEDGAPFMGMRSGGDYTRFNAAIALAFGVTSVRNPGGATEANAEYDRMIATGTWVGPEAVHAGSVIQPPPFGGGSFAYPTTPQEWEAEAARQADAGMTYFKLYTDLTEAELGEGARAAKAHGLIPIAHLNAVSWTRAVELGVEQLEHALPTSPELLAADVRAGYANPDPTGRYMFRWFELADLDGPLVGEMIRTLAERKVPVDLTLMVQDITYHADDLTEIFPPNETRFYHPESFASAMANYEAIAGMWSEGEFDRARAAWPRVLELAGRLHRAGVPLMIGTDGTGGAPVYARELGHHVAAGIPVWEVLRMATAGNAELMGWGDRTGRVSVGMEADLVFLRSDPVEDVRHVREVDWVVTNGRLHRTEELLAVAQALLDGS